MELLIQKINMRGLFKCHERQVYVLARIDAIVIYKFNDFKWKLFILNNFVLVIRLILKTLKTKYLYYIKTFTVS